MHSVNHRSPTGSYFGSTRAELAVFPLGERCFEGLSSGDCERPPSVSLQFQVDLNTPQRGVQVQKNTQPATAVASLPRHQTAGEAARAAAPQLRPSIH